MTAFTVLLGVSSYFIIDHYREAEHQEQLYDSLVQLVEDSETEPVEPIIYSEDKTILPELTELYRQNNDLVGWICVEDTNINYPVMQTVDNPNYYLKRGFDKEYSSYGCPYVQEEDDVFEQFHPKSITPFIDPFDKAEEEQIEEEKERLRQLELSKVRQALSMLQPVQRERLLKSVLFGISSRKIAKEEGINYSSVDKSIAAAIKNFKKFYENL